MIDKTTNTNMDAQLLKTAKKMTVNHFDDPALLHEALLCFAYAIQGKNRKHRVYALAKAARKNYRAR